MARSRATVLAAFTLFSLPFSALAQQATTRVDFGREVQPILRERCYGCHGPEQQMNGFRLDRRADALRGGTQTVIGPGNAEGTLLYRRLTDTRAGIRMPPTGSLDANAIAIIKAWIDQGVEWPDELAGVPASPPVDPAAERLATLIRDADRGAVDALLKGNPASVRGRASGGTTPLMAAALYGDADLLQRMLAMGADPRATNVAGVNALMWALPDTAKMRLLLDAGVDVNARSDDRRTALVIAASIVSSTSAVQLLLEYGASPFPAKNQDPIPLQVAARIGNADVFRLLLDYGADSIRSQRAPPSHLLHAMRRAGRHRWPAALRPHPAAGYGPAADAGDAATPRARGWRGNNDGGCGSRRGRAEPAALAGHRRAFHREDRVRLLSPQQRGLVRGAGRSSPRLPR